MGIAFLASMRITQIAREGVAQEIAMRTETQRMMSFLTAETGPLDGRTAGVVQIGPLNEQEARLLKTVRDAGVANVRWASAPGQVVAAPPALAAPLTQVGLNEVGRDATFLLVVGDGSLPVTAWSKVFGSAKQKVLALSRNSMHATLEGGVVVPLERKVSPDELAAQVRRRERDTYRNHWILAISLLVTVIGITNALLMSVTERFREIGTMKCLGAMSSFIRRMYLIESSIVGLTGGLVGCIAGAAFALVLYGFSYGFVEVLSSMDAGRVAWNLMACLGAGLALSVVAAIYPAGVASRMVPAAALRMHV
jgi:hypothetical protein